MKAYDKMHRNRLNIARSAIALAVASTLAGPALANPNGATVVSGSATISSAGNTLTITNTPNAIINWQDFSIGVNETTRFIQQSATSAVLNRITGGNPSQILGTLQSNGRVFLINPAGIMFGKDAVVDVAGLVASTLNITDTDFLAGKHIYNANTVNAGNVTNAGQIRTPSGGFVYLIGTQVENSGVITTPSGEAILAAGHSVDIVDSTDLSQRVTVSAQSQDVNLSQVMTQNGGNIFAVLNTGKISANTVTQDATGKIFFKSAGDITTSANSVTEARGSSALNGGSIIAFADDHGTYQGAFDASGKNGGFVETSAGYLDVSGIDLNLRALDANGYGGSWLLDPFDFTIGTTEAGLITTQLNAGVSVTIDTNSASSIAGSGTAGQGDITIESSITGSCSGCANLPTLTLKAAGDIVIADPSGSSVVSIGSRANHYLNLIMNAGGDITLGNNLPAQSSVFVSGNVNATAGGAISLLSSEIITGGTATYQASTFNLNGSYGGQISSTGNISITTSGAATINSNNGSSIDTNSNLQMNIGGALSVSGFFSGPAITSDGTTTIKAASLTLNGAQIGDSSNGNISISTTGNFSATNGAFIQSAGTLSISAGGAALQDSSDIDANDISFIGASSLTAINGSEITADNNLTLGGGVMTFNSGAFISATNNVTITGGSLNLVGVDISGSNINADLSGGLNMNNGDLDTSTAGNVNVKAASITEVNNSSINGKYVQISSGGNVSLTNSDIVADQEITMQIGGKLYLNSLSSTGGEAHISTESPNTIILFFPSLFSGGYVLDGFEGYTISPLNPSTGFFAGASLLPPAILNQNLLVTYGGGQLGTIVSQTTTNTLATNGTPDAYGPDQSGPAGSTVVIFEPPLGYDPTDDFSEVKECS